jgi:hypothetical protein
VNLEMEANSLLEALQGKSPCKANLNDKRGWGSSTGSYTVVVGYKEIQAIPIVPLDPTPWKTI